MALNLLPERTFRETDPELAIPRLRELLQAQNACANDLVMPVGMLQFNGGNQEINGLDPIVETDAEGIPVGVTDPSGLYRPVGPVDNQLSGLLDIPKSYINKLRAGDGEFLDLLDHNLNTLAQHVGKPFRVYPDLLGPDGYEPRFDTKKVLVRTFQGVDPAFPGTNGIVRAILSNKFKAYDNLDALMAALKGMMAQGIGPEGIVKVELTDNGMYLYVQAPQIAVAARELTRNYRSPWGTGYIGAGHQTHGEEMPLVHAGFVITNGEVGSRALNIFPMAVFQVCMNGWQLDFMSKVKRVHMGQRLEEGVVNWSDETRRVANELLTNQVSDAVATYLSKDFLENAIRELEKDAMVEVRKPEETIKTVARELVFTEAEREGIFDAFIKGGQLTSGGVGQAVTAFSQKIENPDRAFDFNGTAVKAMKIAARVAA